ncbi:hypothetical protein SPHINGOAX6_50382 [Sphingomonas sp. AX6]|nr:hypothetical protein SPHINGOAX6_50382 [Sphingomonas sp. AX6]
MSSFASAFHAACVRHRRLGLRRDSVRNWVLQISRSFFGFASLDASPTSWAGAGAGAGVGAGTESARAMATLDKLFNMEISLQEMLAH